MTLPYRPTRRTINLSAGEREFLRRVVRECSCRAVVGRALALLAVDEGGEAETRLDLQRRTGVSKSTIARVCHLYQLAGIRAIFGRMTREAARIA